jgi:hypothetical protein
MMKTSKITCHESRLFRFLMGNRGTSMVFIAMSMMVITASTALVTDIGMVVIEKTRMNTAVDAATLAAAKDLPSTTTAIATANHYIQENGYNPSDIAISFSESNNVISITGTKQVNHTFARVLGYDSTTIHPAASARKSGSFGPAFDYAIYSGTTYPGGYSVKLQNVLTISGSANTVNGSVHANYRVDVSASSTTITGTCEGVDTVNIGSNPGITNPRPYSPNVPMPDFSAAKPIIKAAAIAAGRYYSGNFSKTNCGSALNLTSPVYVEGNANLSDISFSGAGCIYVKGTIDITGTGTSYASDSNICMYSDYVSPNKSSEAINFGGSDKNFKGILYAPNGSISVTGSNYTFNGSVVGKVVDISGSAKVFTKSDVAASFPYVEESIRLIR